MYRGSAARPGLGLLVMGMFWIVFGSATLSACGGASGARTCGGAPVAFLVIGLLLFVGGLLLIEFRRRPRASRGYNPAVPPPIVVPDPGVALGLPKIRCAYCGTMYDSEASTCPACGAPPGRPTPRSPGLK